MIQVLDFDGVEGRVVIDNYKGVASSGTTIISGTPQL